MNKIKNRGQIKEYTKWQKALLYLETKKEDDHEICYCEKPIINKCLYPIYLQIYGWSIDYLNICKVCIGVIIE